MADSEVSKPEDSAEKAYAAASEAIVPKVEDVAPPVEFPAKPTRAVKAVSEPVALEVPPAVVAPVVAKPPLARAAKPVKAPKPAVKRAAAKTAPAAAVKPVVAKAAKSAPIKPRKASVQKIKTAPKATPKTAKPSPVAAPSLPFIAKIKEIPMDVTASIKDAVSGAQEKAKEAFAKSSAAASEYGEFAKGNVEAFVESGKILASGLQELGTKFVADSKTAFETAATDAKALSSVKSPVDFFKLQTEILRRNFDSAIAYGTKNSEAVVKLTGDVFAPISGRVSLAVEKVKKAA